MSAQQAWALPLPAASNTVVINARCSLRVEADQRVVVSRRAQLVTLATRVGKQGNVPYELVRRHTGPRVREPDFVDAAARSLREGRILVLLAGDGIRECVQSLTELVSRNASKAFTLGVIEVAIYRLSRNRFAVQPRVLSKTEVVTRHSVFTDDDLEDEAPGRSRGPTAGGDAEHLRAWWQPIIAMKFDDPEQKPPRWLAALEDAPSKGARVAR
jgi:hypothetical protein